jgi:hypothetical protein
MSEFTFIAQKYMGDVRPKDRRALLSMEKKYLKLVEQLQELEVAREDLLTRVAETLQIDTTGPFRGMSIEQDGKVHVTYCPCVTCQATLNNMSAADAAEEMIARGLIHAEQAAGSRAFAASVDLKRGKPMVN